MRARHLLLTALLGLLAGLSAVACGSSDGGAGAPTPQPSVAPSPTATPAPRLWVLATLDDPDPFARPRTVLLYSDDIGASWRSLADSGLADTTTSIDFLDSVRGVAVGGPTAQRTSDGGRTWTTQIQDQRQAPDPFLVLVGVHLDPSGTASVLGNVIDERYLNASGYAAWRLPADGSPPDRATISGSPIAALGSMCLTPSGVGVATGSFRFSMALVSYGTTLGTSDGGASWSVIDSIDRGAVAWYGTACAGERDLWRFGNFSTGGVILPSPSSGVVDHSVDGGATWTGPANLGTSTGAFLASGAFVDRSTGWISGSSDAGPIVLHTSDAGESFSSQVLPAGVTGVGSIAFLDERFGLAGASGIDGTTSAATPLVIVTSDGGASWSAAALPAGVSGVQDVDVTR